MIQSHFCCIEAKKTMSKTEQEKLDQTLDFHLPPIETFMQLPAKVRKEAAFQVFCAL